MTDNLGQISSDVHIFSLYICRYSLHSKYFFVSPSVIKSYWNQRGDRQQGGGEGKSITVGKAAAMKSRYKWEMTRPINPY